MRSFQISASLLAADFARLGEEASSVIKAGADRIHLDVMDNHYVPNLTVGPVVCQALREYGIQAPIDVHLMVKPVDALILAFAKAGATRIAFHPDASEDVNRSLQLIHDHHCEAGLSFNPATPLDNLEHTLPQLQSVMIMSVNPGFGGQAFIPETLKKIKMAREIITKQNVSTRLEVDGGVKSDNIKAIAEAGADTFIMGTAIFSTQDYHATIQKLRSELIGK